MQDDDFFLTTTAVCARYGGIVSRTVDRWVKKGALPKPVKINGRLYFRKSQLDQHERERESVQ